jgi:predicted double-glycine peptidase
VALATLAFAISAGAATERGARFRGEPILAWVAGIPDVMQSNSYSCGAASVQAVGQRYGVWRYQDEWAKELGTSSEEGTHPQAMVEGLRQLELDAELVEGMTLEELKAHIDAGHAVIVDFQAWGEPADGDYSREWEDGHYCVALGYTESYLLLEDPSLLGTRGWVYLEDLSRRWHDYENEEEGRRDYRNMALVVIGKRVLQPRFSPIE